MTLPQFAFHAPSTVDEALALLETHGARARPMAGGTDLLPRLDARRIEVDHLVYTKRIGELDRLAFAPETGLHVGANVVLADLAAFEPVRAHYPILVDAIETLATPQVRHKATMIGNLCNASPCADTAPPLMAHRGTVLVAGRSGRREVPADAFITGPGRTALEPGELACAVRIPIPPEGLRTRFLKHSPRSRVDISAVSVAVAVRLEDGLVAQADIFMGTVGPTPLRAARAEQVLLGREPTPEHLERAAAEASDECRPNTDFRATEGYKRRMVHVLVRRALAAVTGEA